MPVESATTSVSQLSKGIDETPQEAGSLWVSVVQDCIASKVGWASAGRQDVLQPLENWQDVDTEAVAS
jgi:hypothetical protein